MKQNIMLKNKGYYFYCRSEVYYTLYSILLVQGRQADAPPPLYSYLNDLLSLRQNCLARKTIL